MPPDQHRAVYPLWQETQHDLFSTAGRAGRGSSSSARSAMGDRVGMRCAARGGWRWSRCRRRACRRSWCTT